MILRFKLGCLVFFCLIALIGISFVSSVFDTYQALTSREPLEISLKEYKNLRPDEYWLKLTDCQFNLLRSAYKMKDDDFKYAFVPLTVPNQSQTGYFQVLLHVKDKQIFEQLHVLYNLRTDNAKLKYAAQHPEKIIKVTDIMGTVCSFNDLDGDTKDSIRKHFNVTESSSVIIMQNKEPSLLKALWGFVLCGFFLFLFILYCKFLLKPKNKRPVKHANMPQPPPSDWP